ncbi:hypothetical protein GOD90_10690 [Sinorhizobium medicae]|nr:hypothetical protein [Sinorhizobium medicae]
MSEMVERIARILDPDAWRDNDYVGVHIGREASKRKARELIEAMREPTAVMKRAVRDAGGPQALAYANAAWPTMIDAALGKTT